MKKILILMAFVLLIVGCAKAEPETMVDELLYDDRIIVGVSPDYPPFQSLNNKGEVVGFEVDLLKAVVEIVNKNNDLDLGIEYRPMAFEMLVSAIHTRQVDIGSSGFTWSPDRDAVFSEDFFDSEQIIIVDQDSDIMTIDDLKGKRIGANLGSTGEAIVKEIEGVRIVNSDYPLLFTALKANSLDVVVADKIVGNAFIKEMGLRRLEEALDVEETMFLFRHDLKYLEDEFNEAIIEYRESSEYLELLEKWGLEWSIYLQVITLHL